MPAMLYCLMLILFLCLGIMRKQLSNPLEVHVLCWRIWFYRLGCFPYKENLKSNSNDLKQRGHWWAHITGGMWALGLLSLVGLVLLGEIPMAVPLFGSRVNSLAASLTPTKRYSRAPGSWCNSLWFCWKKGKKNRGRRKKGPGEPEKERNKERTTEQ